MEEAALWPGLGTWPSYIQAASWPCACSVINLFVWLIVQQCAGPCHHLLARSQAFADMQLVAPCHISNVYCRVGCCFLAKGVLGVPPESPDLVGVGSCWSWLGPRPLLRNAMSFQVLTPLGECTDSLLAPADMAVRTLQACCAAAQSSSPFCSEVNNFPPRPSC